MGSSSNNSFFCNLKFSHKISSFRSKKLLDDEPSYAKTHDKLIDPLFNNESLY